MTVVTGERFSGQDWYGRELDGEAWVECELLDVDLTEVVTRTARFEQCTFAGCKLNASVHEGSSFAGSTFRSVSFFDARFTRCKLLGARFLGTCTFRPFHAEGGDWSFVELRGQDLSGARLHGVKLVEADLSGANLAGADLTGCDLSRASLHQADLRGADLRGCILDGVALAQHDLTGTHLDVDGAAALARSLGAVVE
ncbi:MAG: pentapeptide repeat-containing protein [Motilibacteraceae bacterium]